MSVRKPVQVGSPVIRAKARSVASVTTKQVQKTIDDLVDSMRDAELVGMAAPQIGVGLRIFVTEIRKTKFRKLDGDTDPLRVFINPRIVQKTKRVVSGFEGCGSVAHTDLFGLVPRADGVTVSALDQNGFPFTLTTKGLLARVIQHELDHLDGKVFLDRVTDTRSLRSSDVHVKSK